MKFFPAAKIRNFLSDVPRRRHCRDDELGDYGAIYNDEDHADLCIQYKSWNHLRLIYWSTSLEHIQTPF